MLHDARAVEVSMYFPSRKPAIISVQKHAKRVKVCILKIQMEKRETTSSKTQSSNKKLKSEEKYVTNFFWFV